MVNKNLILALVVVFVSFAYAQQIPSFHQFYGQIVNTGGSIITSPNYNVQAYINGSLINELMSENGYYGYNEVFLVENGVNGNVITFTLDGYFSANYTFANEQTTQLNLVYNTSAPLICINNDGDGYNGTGGACGTLDCNDFNAAVNPGATESCSTSYDDNCNNQINEGCGGTTTTTTGGGGGGGGVIPGPLPQFSIDKNPVEVKVLQGGSIEAEFTITNPSNVAYTVNIGNPDNGMIGIIGGNNFVLPAGQARTIKAIITSSAGQEPNLYLGKVNVWTSYKQEELIFSIEVVSPDALFDIVIEMLDQYKHVLPGDKILATFYLTKLVPGAQDVILNYVIKDEDENIIYREDEQLTVTDRTVFDKEFTLPTKSGFGKYVLYAQLNYDDKTASSSSWFDIGPRKIDTFRWIIIIVILSVAIISIIIIIITHYLKSRISGYAASAATSTSAA